MKKTILALLVLLTAALVFTGCPKEPDMPKTPNLDGTWLYAETDDFDGNLEEPVAFPFVKLEIAGNTVKSYAIDDDYYNALGIWYYMGATGDKPEETWSEPATGTLTVSGKTITFSFDGDSQTATLSDDNKSLVAANPDYDPEDPDLGPETITFVKQ